MRWENLSPTAQRFLLFLHDFTNPPLIGALVPSSGLSHPSTRPFLPAALKADSSLHGLRRPSATPVVLSPQAVGVGVSLSSTLRKIKREGSGSMSWVATAFILLVRFLLWPVIFIGVIYSLATKTKTLSDDLILWFTMMIMPTGPPAVKLVAMADEQSG